MLICPGCRTEYHEQLEVCPKDNLPLIVRSSAADSEVAGPHATETALSTGLMVGEFRIEAPIFEGEMGTTYSAIHPLIRKRVAIRVLHERYAQDHRAVTRFVMEARAVNEIGHHNIVDILSIGELWDGRNYLVMELIDGDSLREILRRTKRLGPGAALALYEQLCDGLQAVHTAGFIHRDLRPENIVVLRRPPHPFVKIQDFGLAMLKGDEESENDVATLVGTPVYMAPELSMGSDVDARADIYSIGAVLYELLTGQPPFSAHTLFNAFNSNQQLVPRPPSDLVRIDPQLEQVVLQSLAWDPAERYGSTIELAGALRRAISEPPIWDVTSDGLRPTHSTPSVTRPPPPREVEVPAPESIIGDVEDDELDVTDGKAVVQMIPSSSKTVLGHIAPEEQIEDDATDGEPEDEEPTDIFTGQAAAAAVSRRAPVHDTVQEEIELKPDAFLGDVETGELVEDDTQLTDPPFDAAIAAAVDTLASEGATAPQRPETSPAEKAQPEAPAAIAALAVRDASGDDEESTVPPDDNDDEDDPYCSIEIIGEAEQEDRK